VVRLDKVIPGVTVNPSRVILNPSAVLLSEAKHLDSPLRVNFVKDLAITLRINSVESLNCPV
jgi:hypothetical protein